MKKSWWVWSVLVVMYVVSRLWNLTILPVFADEAIYIRWAQMLSRDFHYLFLPLYDGKTPLFMWLTALFLPITPLDPLWASRLVGVIVGLVGLIPLITIAKQWKVSSQYLWLVGGLWVLVPMAHFYSRMGLTDILLTVMVGFTLWALVSLAQKRQWRWALICGVFWGLSLWSKLPGIFLIPVFMWMWWVELKDDIVAKKKVLSWIQLTGLFVVAGGVGLTMLFTLRVSEWFPFLFQRSQDFTLRELPPLPAYLTTVALNSQQVARWLFSYVTLPVLVAPILGLMSKGTKKPFVVLGGGALLFALPFVLSGKFLASRYFLPVMVFLIPASAVLLARWWKRKQYWFFGVWSGWVVIQSIWFMVPTLFNPSAIPFSPEDREQYLTEWSSGHGIVQVRDFIKSQSQTRQIKVATEGYFGTLPDGLIMYFDRDPAIKNIEIFGVGQPIVSINPRVVALAKDYPTYIVVNSHRFSVPIESCCRLVASYPRPFGGPSLLLLEYKGHD